MWHSTMFRTAQFRSVWSWLWLAVAGIGALHHAHAQTAPAEGWKLAAKISDATSWAPRGGEIRFMVTGPAASVPDITAYISWQGPASQPPSATGATAPAPATPVAAVPATPTPPAAPAATPAKPGTPPAPGAASAPAVAEPPCGPQPPSAAAAQPTPPAACLRLDVRRIEVAKDGSTVTFAAFIPAGLANAPSGQKHIFPFVPAAYVFIHAPGNPVQIHEIGITSRTLAAIFTIVAVVCAGWMMYRFAKYLGVPGPSAAAATGVGGAIASALRGFSVPLRIISSAQGWASLSQFQMMLWTFVIGAGAVYVMSLTGSLIPISPGTLVLLGIAGGAAVLTEVKASQQQQPTAPAPVLELRTVGPPLDTEILVSWLPSATGATATSYIVQYEHPGAPNEWRYASSDLRSPGFRIVGLDPNTAYRVRVLARNTAGNSAEAVVPTPTANVPAVAASITNLRVQPSSLNDSEVVLEWDAAAGALPTDFIVQMRRADTDEPWDAAAGPPTVAATTGRLMVRGLAATTRYDFRVRRATVAGGWTYLTVKTQPLVRTPKWSDIVTDTDRPAEIDVTRVQMLFFTVISAFFVGLKIIDTGLIPDIDPTYVTLMGISNGVYVTAKFVRN